MIYGKKGFLLGEETVKIIIAVIAIGFLAYFLFALYNSNTDKKELEQAQASLDYLIENINSGEDVQVEIFNPEGWYLVDWPKTYKSKEYMPTSCSNMGWNECICICNLKGTISYDGRSKNCDRKGVCLETPEEILININNKEIVKIDPPLIFEIKHYQNGVELK